jgi:hypothetical protein
MSNTEDTVATCGWPGCTAESSQPFTDGWSLGDLDFGMEHGMLCPYHGRVYEELAVNLHPPTLAKN